MLSMKKPKYKNCTAFFQNGFLFDISPRNPDSTLYDQRDVAYNATTIISDGMNYSLENEESINAIPIPNFTNRQDTTFSLDYILRMCASNLRNQKRFTLSTLVLIKATEIMPYSNIDWSENDYLRLVCWLYEDGEIQKGKEYEKYIKTSELIQKQVCLTSIAKQHLTDYAKYTDLVSFNSYSGSCCHECAILSGRVYSISGNSAKFPLLPKSLADRGGFHVGCNTSLSPYAGNVYYLGKKYSADLTFRPYMDERTPDDILSYETRIGVIKKKAEEEQRYFNNKKEYSILKQAFPDLTPKSMTAYLREKNNNTSKYILLLELASKNNLF